MLHRLAAYLMAIGLGVAAATAQAAPVSATTQAAPTVSPEIRQLAGKLVWIYYEVNLLGGPSPSPLHTGYLVTVLEHAGVRVAHITDVNRELNDPFKVKKPDVVIFGEMPPPPRFTPEELRDPFNFVKNKNMQEAAQRYAESRPKLERDAAAAEARVIKSNEVAAALGLHVTEPQMIEARDARMRQVLRLVVPEVRFEQIALGDTVDFLRDISGANIFVNWRALEAAGISRNTPVTLRLRETPLAEVLDKLLEQAAAAGKNAKLGHAMEDGVITISTSEGLKGK